MNKYFFPRRLTRRVFPDSTGAAAAGLALAPCSRVLGQSAPPARIGRGFHSHELWSDDFVLASRVTIRDAEDDLAAQLGDGKETDDRTNRPDDQTNPALFAAPHALTEDSKGNFFVLEWIPTGRPRKFKHVPA
jgi:hypothetical protein